MITASRTSLSLASTDVRRILFIRFGGIGDILMTTPTLRAVKSRYPLSQIDYVVGHGFRDVLGGHPAIRRILEFQKRGNDLLPHRLLPFLDALRQERYDLVVNLQPSVKTNILTWAASPGSHLTFRKDQAIQEMTGRRRHAVNDFYETIQSLDVPRIEHRGLDFVVPPEARVAVDRLFRERDINFGTRVVVLHAAANHRVNRWPTSHYAALCDALTHCLKTFVLFSGHRRDRSLIRAIRDKTRCPQRCLDLSGLLSLKELGALLERADMFVTGDTGPMHIASALGVPVISLFGAADPDRTGPLSPESRTLSDRTSACVPCHARSCRYGKEPRCMRMLLPSTVIDAVEAGMRQSWQTLALQMETVTQ